jgi:hypothetical protein
VQKGAELLGRSAKAVEVRILVIGWQVTEPLHEGKGTATLVGFRDEVGDDGRMDEQLLGVERRNIEDGTTRFRVPAVRVIQAGIAGHDQFVTGPKIADWDPLHCRPVRSQARHDFESAVP